MTDAPQHTGLSLATQAGQIERPVASTGNALFGSDVVADALRALDIPWIALNPGASFRGLHDSLVNHIGNETPQMLLCLHEEHAVAIAHGWAKVTGTAMAAAVHSNVGLFHATMAIFNAWVDRMPVIVLGATGPVDAMKRRPWIDWIHTAIDQGAVIRPYTKWDDQPASAGAARESVFRGAWLAGTAPKGPVYINLDAGMQEAPLAEPLAPVDPARLAPRVTNAVPDAAIAQALALLRAAKSPVILAGRVSRSSEAWAQRVALAETFKARVVTDLKTGCAFPTDHPLHAGPPRLRPAPQAIEALKAADLVLSLDWIDLAGTLSSTIGADIRAKVIQVSVDHHSHGGWSMDYQALPPVDLFLSGEPEPVVAALVAAAGVPVKPLTASPVTTDPAGIVPAGAISVERLAYALRAACTGREVTLSHLPLSWDGKYWPFRHPLDFLGSDGGGGIGAGPGITVGAALALKGSGRMVVGVCGDGDFLMGVTAIWTAVHYRLPALFVVANNRSFFNDEVHQERVAVMRGRPVENKWIGLRMADPEVDVAGMARAQGAVGIGPVWDMTDLPKALTDAIAAVDAGQVAVVDVRVDPNMMTDPLASPAASQRGK